MKGVVYMLNIENYEQWAEVCDDDELILELYNEGIRPGTDEFAKLLGNPYKGEPAGLKEYVILGSGFAVTILLTVGSVKLIKFAGRKMKQAISNKNHEGKEGA